MSNLVTSAYGWLFLPLCSAARGRRILNPSVFSPEDRLHTFMFLSRLSPSALHHRKLKGWHFFRKLYCPLLAPPTAHPPSPIPLYPSLKPFSHLSRNQNATGEGPQNTWVVSPLPYVSTSLSCTLSSTILSPSLVSRKKIPGVGKQGKQFCGA